MYRNFDEIVTAAKRGGPCRVSVVSPEDRDILRTVVDGMRQGLIEPILIGRKTQVEELARNEHFPLEGITFLDEQDLQKASETSVEMARRGEVSFIVKGNILTTHLYRALLRALRHYSPDEIACTLCFHHVAGFEKIFLITDSGVNIHPDLEAKKRILRSAIRIMSRLGWKRPRVKILASPRLLEDRSPYKQDALELRRLCQEGVLGECEVYDSNNFWALLADQEMEEERFPDIFLVPNIEAGNILVKSIDHFGLGMRQCVTVGAGIFLLTPSRSDGYETRMINLSLGVVLSSSWRG